MDNEVYVDICRAAEILNVSTVTARKLLGKPDKVESTKYNLPHYLYSFPKILNAIDKRQQNAKKKYCDVCRKCHIRCNTDDLIGGRCMQCRADLCVFNFCSCGKLPFGKQNPRMIECLRNALAKAESGVDHD